MIAPAALGSTVAAMRLLLLTALLLVVCVPGFAEDAKDDGDGDVKTGCVVIELTGDLPLRAQNFLFGEEGLSLHTATMRLRQALQGHERQVVLDLSHGFSAGAAACEELAATLRERTAGDKKVVCIIDDLTDAGLILAAACDEVVLAEAGMAQVDGVALESWYGAEMLGKLGIVAHAVTSGPYKSAPEIFTRNDPSPEAAAELKMLAEGIDTALIRLALIDNKRLDVAGLTAARAKSPQTSELAVATHLVDRKQDPGEFRVRLPKPVRELDGHHEMPDLSSFAGLMTFWGNLMKGEDDSHGGPTVAVVELAGDIMPGEASQPGETICDGDTVAMIDKLADEDRVVAVVLRLNTGGGDAGASDRIHRAVRRLDQKKPVIALFDQVCASGGYYIGCAAREIYVHRTTITASIGVFAVVPDVTGTTNLLGLHRHVTATGPRADLFGMSAWNEDKATAIRQIIDDVDQRFQGLVAERRKLTADQVKALAGGRVCTGDQAIERKLADGISHLIACVRKAREAANHKEPLPIERYPKHQGLAARLGLIGSSLGPNGALTRLPGIPARLATMATRLAQGKPNILAQSCAFGPVR